MSQSVAECRRVSQHFSTAVSIRRKVLQNQNSATLCDTCDTLQHHFIFHLIIFIGQAENTELSETSEMSEMSEMSETSEKISEMSETSEEISEKISEMSEMSEKISE